MITQNGEPAAIALSTRLAKRESGIDGLDELTLGGLPAFRTTLVLGGPGCGKSMFGLTFLTKGLETNEPGILVTTEQTRESLIVDAKSVGIDLQALESQGRLILISIEEQLHERVVETGEYSLDGFLSMISRAAIRIGAKRLVIDGIDGFYSHFSEDQTLLRSEIHRITIHFSGLGLTTIITGSPTGSEHRLEEYLTDCVLVLDHRLVNQIGTRRLRVLKYRGTAHGTDEYPFVITSKGLRVFPISSITLDHGAPESILTTGIRDLDSMLSMGGFYRGSTILVSGETGTGKTNIACRFIAAAASAGLRSMYFSFEESPEQIMRNIKSTGLDLRRVIGENDLTLRALRPSVTGLEQHLVWLQEEVEDYKAEVIVIDPITSLILVGTDIEVKAMLTRLLDHFKARNITVLLTSLIYSGDKAFGADIAISSLVDAIILVERKERDRRRCVYLSVIKSRGMAGSREIRELLISSEGMHLRKLEAREA